MHRMLAPAAVILAAVAACALPGASVAGSYLPPPGDARPVWSPDGSRIAFLTSRAGHAIADVPVEGGAERRLLEGIGLYAAAISPDWRWIAFPRYESSGQELWISRIDGSGARPLVHAGFGIEPTWSPDSRGLIFRQADGSLALVAIEGGLWTLVPSGGSYPAWSPDGTRFAYMAGREGRPDLYVLDFSGGTPRLLAGGPGAQLEPKWSPDGTRIAFLTQPDDGRPFRFGVVRPDGSGLVTYPAGPGVSNAGSFAWTPSSDGIVFARGWSQGILRLDLATGKTAQLTSFGSTPMPSPDGLRIAFASGGECRDRDGIYVVASDGTGLRRLTNDCRVLGTPGDDVLRGTGLADVVLGLGGDDRLSGLSAAYVGDTLGGGDGDDVLVGTFEGDTLRGGAGSDRLFGGLSADELDGGPGPDRIDAQAGRDFVHARDGARDVVLCGTNRGGTPERDEAWVDDVDLVRGCEIVHRRAGR
jgi:Tol biopolymer transport system component